MSLRVPWAAWRWCATQTLASEGTKALTGSGLAQACLLRGFTTLRDLGSMDPTWPTVDLRNAIDAGLVDGPRLLVAGHLIRSTGSHADIGGDVRIPLAYAAHPACRRRG